MTIPLSVPIGGDLVHAATNDATFAGFQFLHRGQFTGAEMLSEIPDRARLAANKFGDRFHRTRLAARVEDGRIAAVLAQDERGDRQAACDAIGDALA